MMRSCSPGFFFEVVDTKRTRDAARDEADGSWATYCVRPPGAGWRIAIDGERFTTWTRRRPVISPHLIKRAGGGWLR